ncbi:hypothetical protein Taro_025719 [Colocasia esculenta]|uniref:Exocyst complex component EXOC2/Sec5 N-terminal domain-containing protein n=1 Tax=Colocasia esculenta TaxID=4460 RepID=A0A843V9K5_COLES|nr:hypothetical protein [Colocasia esculenta]
MSSDSEDLDEDELLQIALKEQAERDLSYQKRPKGGRPVVNLVQAPPPPPSMSNPTHQRKPNPASGAGKGQQKPPKGRVEDDDDSEVELLSISSGDEDSSSRDRGQQQQRGRPGDGGGRRGGRDDPANGDRGWDGVEPNIWKRVDEAELARRVREMREARAAPMPQTFGNKAAALGQKGLTNLQSLPRGIEALDPLGLGIIDSKTLTLITEASESSPSGIRGKGDKDGLDPSTREKIQYYSEKFDPKLFLSRVHKDTSAADLESGALTIKTDLRGRTQQKKQLVKENFDCFVSCKTTIDDIESKLRQIEDDPEGAGTTHLYNAIQDISALANRAFQPLLERQVQTEKIRSVQGMLQRFRTLFNLPSAIRGNIGKGEYDLAVREYRKAKSIVLPSHVGILKRVLEEVEKVMQEFKAMLYKSMEDPHLDLTDLENSVRLLLELEPDSDPIWHFLGIQNRRIRGLLEKCSIDHETRMEMLRNEIKEKVLSDERWRQLQQNSNKSVDVDPSLYGDSQLPLDGNEEVDVLRAGYIRRLTAVLVHHLPAFWKLALSVFNGKFAKVSAGNVLLDQDTSSRNSINRAEDKAGEMKYSSHSIEEVASMVHGTISAYEAKVHNTFRDFEESNVLRPYMSNSIKEIAKACQSIEGKESAPPSAVKSLRALHSEITKMYISRLCSWMRTSTEEITRDETWVPLSILERNRSPYTISHLPLAFRSVAVSAMDQINVMIQSLRDEVAKSSEMFAQIQEIQESVRIAFLNCFLDFAGYLERIGGELSSSRSIKETSHLQSRYSLEPEGVSALSSGRAVSDSHKRLLIVLSNIGYCKDELCNELYKKYKHLWLQSRYDSTLTISTEGDAIAAWLRAWGFEVLCGSGGEGCGEEVCFGVCSRCLADVQRREGVRQPSWVLSARSHVVESVWQWRRRRAAVVEDAKGLSLSRCSLASIPASHQLQDLCNLQVLCHLSLQEAYAAGCPPGFNYDLGLEEGRERDEQYADVRDLVMSFSALEEKILEHYTYAKANLIRNAALNYLLDSGVQWGAAPAVKGIRDATIELLHSLVSVHAEVSSGAKPLLEKTLGTLVEGLFDMFLNIVHENKSKDSKLLDPNGFCQLMLELEYFETVLHAYFSSDAREALKSLQGLLLEKASESATEAIENPAQHRRQQTRGSEDAMADDRQQGATVSPDDLIALAQQLSADLLEGELERTRLNISCFMESSLQPSSAPVPAKNHYTSFRGPVNSPSYRTMGSPGYSRHRRR